MDPRRGLRRRSWLLWSIALIGIAMLAFIADPGIIGRPVMWLFGS